MNKFSCAMQLRLLVFLLSFFSLNTIGISQECCQKEILKLEKKLGRKYDSFERINVVPKDGEVSSMNEVFYFVHKKKKHGIINGNRLLIYNSYWESVELISFENLSEKFTFFEYRVEGESGIGSVEYGLHLPPKFESVSIQIIDDSNTICLIGEKNNQTRVDWMKQGNKRWISKELNFTIQKIDIYRRASTLRYGKYDDLVFFNGKSEASSFELKSGKSSVSGPLEYTNTVKIDNIESPTLLCLNHQTGYYDLLTPNEDNKLKTIFSYNEVIVNGRVIEGGLIIAKTELGKFKLPLSEHAEDFQLDYYDQLFHSDQNLFLIKGNHLVIVNRQGSRQIIIRNYYEPDVCGNYHPEVHLSEEGESFFGHPIRSLEGSLFVTRNGQLLNDSVYLMSVLDKKQCLYLFWEDEYREGVMGTAAAKNYRGVMDANGRVLLNSEYSAIWKKGNYFLTMKGGSVVSMILTPTLYEGGKWILYDSDFNSIGSPVEDAEFREGGVIEKNGFTIDDTYYTTYEFTKKFFGVGVYNPD